VVVGLSQTAPQGTHPERMHQVPSRWLPSQDYWSTPFAEALLYHLDIFTGATVLDVASGDGIPAFYVAEKVGPTGQVLGIDCSENQLALARAIQGKHLPWLRFECRDMRSLDGTLPSFDRITGNLSVMFFRPDRFNAVRGLVEHLKPGGQMVLTFPSQGTFDSLWRRIDQEMDSHGLQREQQRLKTHLAERPSADEARGWLETLNLARIQVSEWPLEVATGAGALFLNHPLLSGGFLEDVYECFDDPRLAHNVMNKVSEDVTSFTPLIAQRCVLSAWKSSA
jgi:ubiquinone/menaquinone biosynthesis C-methylase UbiE